MMHPDVIEQLRSLGINPDALPAATEAGAANDESMLFAGSEPAPATQASAEPAPDAPAAPPVASPSAEAVAAATDGLPSIAELTARLIAIELVLRRQGLI